MRPEESTQLFDYRPLLNGDMSPHEAGLFEVEAESTLRALSTKQVATVHASSVLSAHGAVILIGISGTGKTTLALECARHGLPHIGDEFCYFSFGPANCWHIEYPIGIKMGSPFFRNALNIGTKALSPLGIASLVCDRKQLLTEIGGTAAACGIAHPYDLEAIICLRRMKAASCCIDPLSVTKWTEQVLPSIDAPTSRNQLFNQLLAAVSSHHIRVAALRYSESREAASLLSRTFGEA